MLTRVFSKSPSPLHFLAVAPAAEDPSARVPEWQDAEGNPATIRVEFRDGVATVDDALGRFLVDKGYALKRRPILH